MRYWPVLIVAILELSALGSAQSLSGNVFAGYSYLNAQFPQSNAGLNGWTASAEGKLLPHLGFVADFTGEYGSPQLATLYPCPVTNPVSTCLQPRFPQEVTTSVAEHSFLFGPRLWFHVRKFRPFADALVGASHTHDSTSAISASDTAFAYALGGGFDYPISSRFGWRVQADALQTRYFNTSQTNVRVATGLVIRF